MKRLIIALFVMAMTTACGFTSAEKEVIYAGEGDIMRVLQTTSAQDSLMLRQTSKPLTKKMLQGEEWQTLRQRMLATVQNPDNEGVGIAAPQVGLLRQVVAVQRFDKEGEPFEFYINPTIVSLSGEKEAGDEGCLSVPDVYESVERWQQIVITYRDEEFVEHTETIEGFTAVIFQHETDHLKGVLFVDRLQ